MRIASLAVFALFILCLAPWFVTYYNQVVNTDIAYLTTASERLLNGEKMSEAYYDTNPPLSIILSSPSIFLSQTLNIEIYHAIKIYHLSILLFFTLLSALMLRNITTLTTEQKTLLLLGFLSAGTLITAYDFGQRDHLLGLSLFALFVLQYKKTYKIETNTIIKALTLITASIFILLKPHFGLIPLLMFIHRGIIQKRANVCFDTDFIALSVAAIAYIVIMFSYFGDFINTILPDVFDLYLSQSNADARFSTIATMTICAVILAALIIITGTKHKMIVLLSTISVLSFVPAIIQAKGWFYHALPAYMFMGSVLAFLILTVITKVISGKKQQPDSFSRILSLALSAGLVFYIPSALSKTKNIEFTHEKYQKSALAKVISDCKKQHGSCPFYVMHNIINLPHELALYSGQKHASRFPVPWFMAPLIAYKYGDDKNEERTEEIKHYENKYYAMIIEDFEKYDPQLIFVANLENPFDDGKFNLKEYVETSAPDTFDRVLNQYEFVKTIEIKQTNYFYQPYPGDEYIKYDMYKKRDEI